MPGNQHVANRRAVHFITVRVADTGVVNEVKQAIQALLRQRHRLPADAEDDFGFSDPATAMEADAAAARTFSYLLARRRAVDLASPEAVVRPRPGGPLVRPGAQSRGTAATRKAGAGRVTPVNRAEFAGGLLA